MKRINVIWLNGKTSKINIKFILLNVLILSIMLVAFIRADESKEEPVIPNITKQIVTKAVTPYPVEEVGGGGLGVGSAPEAQQADIQKMVNATKKEEPIISRGVLLTSNITMLLALAFLMLVDNTKREEKRRPYSIPKQYNDEPEEETKTI